MLNEAVIIE